MTANQLNMLQGAADGETCARTADRMRYSIDTIRDWRKETLRELGARNVTEAVAVAWRKGLIR